VHFRSKALERTILKIYGGIVRWEFRGEVGPEGKGLRIQGKEVYLLHVYAVTCTAEDQTCSHCFCESASLENC